jgi:hypothetical protein
VSAYDDLIASADELYRAGEFKEAHITYGRAQSLGWARNHYCRHMRGICSRRVAEERIAKALAEPDFRQDFLEQAARWLAKSEANLSSAFDESPEADRGNIRLEQALTEEVIARFMELSGGNPSRRLSVARDFREQGFEMLARV